jgi:hypothetical protein
MDIWAVLWAVPERHGRGTLKGSSQSAAVPSPPLGGGVASAGTSVGAGEAAVGATEPSHPKARTDRTPRVLKGVLGIDTCGRGCVAPRSHLRTLQCSSRAPSAPHGPPQAPTEYHLSTP